MSGIDSPSEGGNEMAAVTVARLRNIRRLTLLFILGLFLSGLTAIPLKLELNLLVNLAAPDSAQAGTAISGWVLKIQKALTETEQRYPFLFYGTDWLAFGHFMIALAFVGALREPIRNRWLYDFGLLACLCVIPYAMIFGAVRGIPVWWRLIDCSFGVLGALPLWWCRKWAAELEASQWHKQFRPGSVQLDPIKSN